MANAEPQHTVEKHIAYEERAVAFIDILGFSDLVDRSTKEPEFLDRLHRALRIVDHQGRAWTAQVRARAGTEEASRLQVAQMDFRSQTFSDCIVLSQKGTFLVPLFISVSQLVMALLELGVLARGGVSIGPLYHDPHIVFGPALVEAYRLESQCAKAPRVLVSGAVFESSQEGLVYFPEQGTNAFYRPCQFLRRDADRLYHVDCLTAALISPKAVIGADEVTLAGRFKAIAGLVEEEFGRRPRAIDTASKWGWFVEYFNDFARARIAHRPEVAVSPIAFDDDEMDPVATWEGLRQDSVRRKGGVED